MARWKDDDERGEFGAWLSGQVGDRTFDWLAAEMAKQGHVHGADYYRAMASGNKPAGRAIGRALREYFGAAPASVQSRRAPADMGALVAAMTDLVGELRAERQSRPVMLRESPASYVDAATVRRRRAYWIERAVDEGKLNAEVIAKRMDWPTSQLAAVRRWLKGDIPDGATRATFAQAVMLPLSVLEHPPETDHERLIAWRREAVAELPAVEEPEAKRRTA